MKPAVGWGLCLLLACSCARSQDCSHVTVRFNLLQGPEKRQQQQAAISRSEDVNVKVAREPATINTVRRNPGLQAAVLLLDTSASMDSGPRFSKGHPEWSLVSAAANGISKNIPSSTKVELITFAEKVTVEAPLLPERSVFDTALARMLQEVPKGRTGGRRSRRPRAIYRVPAAEQSSSLPMAVRTAAQTPGASWSAR